ncbi:MAG: TRAP transporter large permease [Alphaproteobacteria bacterium]
MTPSDIALIVTMFGLLILGVPFAFAIGIAVLAGLWAANIDPVVLAQQLVAGMNSFPLLAVPGFILAGDLMHTGGLSRRLVNIAMVLVGRVRGGLAMVAILSATFFGAISGSAPATTAAIGKLMVPEMVRRGYPLPFSAALAAAYGPIGILIPPSIPLVIWGVIANESITNLFIAGIVPGILVCVALMIASFIYARRHNIPVETTRASGRDLVKALSDGKWALLASVVVLGGIYGGIFTPTEASAVAVVYGLVIGIFVHREMTFAELPGIIVRSMSTTAMVVYIVGVSVGFGWVIGLDGLPQRVGAWVLGLSVDPILILLAVNVLLLIVGTFMDTVAAMIILAALLIHVGQAIGVDPIHYGTVIVMNLGIGMATPPFGYTLFTASAITGLVVDRIIPPLLGLILVEVIALLIVTYVPSAATILLHVF